MLGAFVKIFHIKIKKQGFDEVKSKVGENFIKGYAAFPSKIKGE